MSSYDSTNNLISSSGCYARGMARAHDSFMMLLWLGGTVYLVWLFCTLRCCFSLLRWCFNTLRCFLLYFPFIALVTCLDSNSDFLSFSHCSSVLASRCGFGNPRCGGTLFLSFLPFCFLVCCLGFSHENARSHMVCWVSSHGLWHLVARNPTPIFRYLAIWPSTFSLGLVHILARKVFPRTACYTSSCENPSICGPRTKNRGHLHWFSGIDFWWF